MPEPRETHTAIDARRNEWWLYSPGRNVVPGIDEREALAEVLREATVMRDLHPDYERLADAILAAGWAPAAPRDKVITVSAERITEIAAERDALAATVARVRALADEWEAEADEDEDWLNGPRVAVSEAQQYPATIRTSRGHVADLRAALAPSDPATDTGGEAT